MNREVIKKGKLLALAIACLLFAHLSGCAPTPDNAQIEAAIRASLAAEASPPDLVFAYMEVPMRAAGKAGAVLWTKDETIQRNYMLAYDGDARAFVVSSFTSNRLSESGTYSPVPNDLSLTFSEYAPCFDFSDDFNQQYLLLYAGEGKDFNELRTAFEAEMSADINADMLAAFEVCDLGGDTLVLLVPRYRGMTVWVNALEHEGDLMKSGAELYRSGDEPFYIYCDFDDKLPGYEIHTSLNGQEQFFTTREQLVESIKD